MKLITSFILLYIIYLLGDHIHARAFMLLRILVMQYWAHIDRFQQRNDLIAVNRSAPTIECQKIYKHKFIPIKIDSNKNPLMLKLVDELIEHKK